MNIKYHISIGLIGSYMYNDPLFLLGSVLPDISLIFNEINLIKSNKIFSYTTILKRDIIAYTIFHSLLFCMLFLFISKVFFLGYLLHILLDSFCHTDVLSWRPLYPYNYKVTYGKEIFK